MTTGSEGFTLTIGDLHQVVPMAFPDATVAQQLAARLKSGDEQALAVKIAPLEESDVEGHWRSSSVDITIQLGDDDVEGHAMSVHFPSAAEADRFRKRLMAVGLLAGTIAIGSVSAAAIANAPSIPSGAAIPGPAPITYQAPAGHGFFEGADSVTPAAGAAAEAAVGSGTRGGLVEGADIGMPAAPAAAAGAAAANAANAATRGGLVEGADVDAGAFGIGSSVERAAVANADTKGGVVEGADLDSGASGIGSSVERSRVGGVVEGAD